MMRKALFSILTLFMVSCASEKEELNIFIWGDFIKQELIEDFEAKMNCRVVIDTYDSNESLFAKLKSGASGYDLIFPSGYILDPMEREGMIHPLEKEKIPNLKNIDYQMLDLLKEKRFENAIPYALTYTAIAYRKDKVKDPLASWQMFQRTDLKGRMTLLNDMREVLGVALKTHGFSVNSLKEEEIKIAKEQVLLWKQNLAKFESEQYKNGIASAEYLVVQGYSSDISQITEDDATVQILLPNEGTVFSCDYVAIPKEARSLELAHAFINFILEPEVSAKNMMANYYLSPNKEAIRFLSKDYLSNPAIFPPLDFVTQSEALKDLGPFIKIYIEAWDQIKSK